MATFLLPLIGAAGSMLGGLFGNKQQAGPQLTSGQKTLRDQLTQGASNQLSNLPQDISGYFSNALYGNAANQMSQQNALQRTLASRGLTGSPLAASSLMNMQMQGANQNQQMINQMPLLRMQLLQNALASSGSAFRNSLAGQMQTQTQNQGFGGALGSALNAFGGLGAMTGLFPGGGGQQLLRSSMSQQMPAITNTGMYSFGNLDNTGAGDYSSMGDLLG